MALALEGTPVHKQVNSVTSTTIGAFTTSLASQVFLLITMNGAGSVVGSITGGGLTWAQRIATTSGALIELWSAQAASALSAVTFTVNYTGSGASFTTLDLFAFSGQDTSTIWDGNASVPARKNSGPDPILISTSNADDVVIAGFRMNTTPSPTQGTGFTKISGADYQLAEYKIVSATQTNLSCGIGTGTGDSNGCLADALMQATAAGGRGLFQTPPLTGLGGGGSFFRDPLAAPCRMVRRDRLFVPAHVAAGHLLEAVA